uniref:Uncharacterized protein n=1 Tax=Ananas comosus var. bracteatus TaxID=296719 RepID=A0A6V7Q537_ANACO|nr:unnamed protein product [Ananas comosus var. bracteatus]
MLVEELLRCQIREWYPIFKTHTFPTLFVPLPLPFRRYLLGLPPLNPNPNPINAINAINDDDDEAPPPPPFLLPRSSTPLPRPSPSSLDPLSSSTPPSPLRRRRRRRWGWGRAVVPGARGGGGARHRGARRRRAPQAQLERPQGRRVDRRRRSLRCASFADAALLLRASDSAAHDLSSPSLLLRLRPRDPPDDDASTSSSSDDDDDFYYLALRRWKPSLRPEMEFRCFARRRRLVAVSQRDATAFYPALLDRRREILAAIRSFFDGVVARASRRRTTPEGSGWDQFLRNAEEEIRRQAGNSQNSDAAAGDY